MNESPEKTASPRRGLQNVAALTSVYGGVSPQKKAKPPLSPYMERQLSENRKGGFSSPPMSKQKVYRSPVKAAPVVDSDSDDSDDSDDEGKVPKPPKPGSFEDSFNKLMASSSSYDEVESDSDNDSDDSDDEKVTAPSPAATAAAAAAPSGAAAGAGGGVGKGEKVRSTPVKSTSTDPNAYSSSGVSGSEDEADSSSSSDSSESEDDDSNSSDDDSDDSSISSSSTSSSDGHPIVSQQAAAAAAAPAGSGIPSPTKKPADNKEEEDKEAVVVPATRAVPAVPAVMAAPPVAMAAPEPKPEPVQQQPQQQSRAVEDTPSDESHDEDLKDEPDANKKTTTAARFSPPTNSAAVPPTTYAAAPLVDTDEEDSDEVLQRRKLLSDSDGGTTDTPEDDDDDDPYQSASEHLPHSIDGMENLEVYMDTTESDNDDKSQISHDTPFVKDVHGVRQVNSDEFEDEPLADEHHAIQVEGSTDKAFPINHEPEHHIVGDEEHKLDENALQEHQKEQEPLLHNESAAAIGKTDDDFDHDEEHGSQAESDLSDDLDDDDELAKKRSRRRRCILILSCLACIMLLAIAYIFVWIFVIRKNNESSGGPVDAKQLVGEIFGNIASAQLGSSVTVSGSGLTVAVGAPDYQGPFVAMGQVRVLSRQGSTLSDWAQIGQLLQGDEENDAFGSSLVLSGDGSMLAVGSAKRDGFGYVRVFNLTETNQWQQASRDIVANQTDSGFGATIAVSANGLVVAIGAPSHAVGRNANRTGAVSVYGLFDNAWRLLGEPLVGQGNGDGFGSSVSLSSDGRIVAIGSPGNSLAYPSAGLVQAFEYNIPGNFWQQKGSNIKGDQLLDRIGVSVALSADGQTLATGLVTNDSRGGMVRVYRLGSDSVWTQVGNGVIGEQPFSQWGYSVAISNDGKRVVSGAPLVSTYKGQRAGRVRVFDVSDGEWKEVGKTLEGKGEGDNFGQTVSISGDGRTIIAGAPNFTNTFITPNGAKVLAEAGYAQVYEMNN